MLEWSLIHLHSLFYQSNHNLFHPSIHTPIHSHTHPFTHPSMHTPIHSHTHPFTHPSIHTPIHSHTHPFTHPSIHTPIHSHTHPFTHPSIHTPIHSHTHPFTRPFSTTLLSFSTMHSPLSYHHFLCSFCRYSFSNNSNTATFIFSLWEWMVLCELRRRLDGWMRNGGVIVNEWWKNGG